MSEQTPEGPIEPGAGTAGTERSDSGKGKGGRRRGCLRIFLIALGGYLGILLLLFLTRFIPRQGGEEEIYASGCTDWFTILFDPREGDAAHVNVHHLSVRFVKPHDDVAEWSEPIGKAVTKDKPFRKQYNEWICTKDTATLFLGQDGSFPIEFAAEPKNDSRYLQVDFEPTRGWKFRVTGVPPRIADEPPMDVAAQPLPAPTP